MDSSVTSFSPAPKVSSASQAFDEDGIMGKVGTSVVGSNVETILILVPVAADTGLEVIARWRGDGCVGSRVDEGG